MRSVIAFIKMYSKLTVSKNLIPFQNKTPKDLIFFLHSRTQEIYVDIHQKIRGASTFESNHVTLL